MDRFSKMIDYCVISDEVVATLSLCFQALLWKVPERAFSNRQQGEQMKSRLSSR